jgi:hypothetical protein
MRQSDLFRFGVGPAKKQSAPEKSPEKAPVIDTQSKQNSETPAQSKKLEQSPLIMEVLKIKHQSSKQ